MLEMEASTFCTPICIVSFVNNCWCIVSFTSDYTYSSVPFTFIANHFYRDFITDCFKPSPVRRPYEIPWEQKAMWAFLFGSMLLIAIIGNCIVIWIVLGKWTIYYRQILTGRTLKNWIQARKLAKIIRKLNCCWWPWIYHWDIQRVYWSF